MRFDKFVAQATQKSRADARKLITQGKVTIDDVPCKQADAKVADTQCVRLEGVRITCETFVYFMLDKPDGVVCATKDDADTTVIDLVGKAYPRRNLFPAGRLDKTSTGFVLVTDDGAFAHAILSPKSHVPKTYLVTLDTLLTQEMVDGFAKGVTLADGTQLLPAQVCACGADPCVCKVVIGQGVYHQIKRMFGVYDAGVNALRRIAIGGLMLDETLGEGGFRTLTQDEVRKIQL